MMMVEALIIYLINKYSKGRGKVRQTTQLTIITTAIGIVRI